MSEEGEATGAVGATCLPNSWPGDDVETMGQVVRIAETTNALVKRYEAAGLISSRRDPYGRRLFPKGTGERVRKLKAERLARLGRRDAAGQASADASEGAGQSVRVE